MLSVLVIRGTNKDKDDKWLELQELIYRKIKELI